MERPWVTCSEIHHRFSPSFPPSFGFPMGPAQFLLEDPPLSRLSMMLYSPQLPVPYQCLKKKKVYYEAAAIETHSSGPVSIHYCFLRVPKYSLKFITESINLLQCDSAGSKLINHHFCMHAEKGCPSAASLSGTTSPLAEMTYLVSLAMGSLSMWEEKPESLEKPRSFNLFLHIAVF